MVTVKFDDSVVQNEVAYILHGEERLKALKSLKIKIAKDEKGATKWDVLLSLDKSIQDWQHP